MPTPSGIGAGQTASLTLPLGLTYHQFMIEARDAGGLVADFAPEVEEVRLLVDGDVTYQISADHLQKLNAFYGEAPIAGVLDLFLSRPWMRTIAGEDQTAYGTAGGMQSFALEVDLAAGSGIQKLDVYAVQSAAKPFGTHLRLQKHVHTQGVAGEAEISDLPRGAFSLMALHLTTSGIEDVDVVVDNRRVRETSKTIRSGMSKRAGRTEQAGFTHVDFLTENRLIESLPMNVSDFRVRADFTATGNFAIYSETLRNGR